MSVHIMNIRKHHRVRAGVISTDDYQAVLSNERDGKPHCRLDDSHYDGFDAISDFQGSHGTANVHLLIVGQDNGGLRLTYPNQLRRCSRGPRNPAIRRCRRWVRL